jgi:hypothetical protein
MEYTATYDANDNLTQVETTVLRDGTRVPHERYVVEYSNNHPVSIEAYGYIGETINSQARDKATNTYDAGGNLTLSESYHRLLWDEWTGVSKYVYTYDANGRELSCESYSWNGSPSSGSWIGNYKYAYTYDANGKELSYESYSWEWDTSSDDWKGDWKGNSKYAYEERNEYGDVILSKDWSWENNRWNEASYTVYYPGGSDPVATERVDGAEPPVYIHGGMLHIQTGGSERISVYTPNGAKVYEQTVPADATTVSAERLPKGVLIVRGSSGWVKKVVK